MNKREIGYVEVDVILAKACELLVPHWGSYRDDALVRYLNKVKTSGPEFSWRERYVLETERKSPTYRDASWWFTDEEYELARELLSPYARVLIKMRQARGAECQKDVTDTLGIK